MAEQKYVNLAGIFLLYVLSLKYNRTNICFYWDDRLAVFRNIRRSHSQKIKKELQKLFQWHGLKLTIKCDLKIVDFSDVTLNLIDSTDKPYHNPYDDICYIHN